VTEHWLTEAFLNRAVLNGCLSFVMKVLCNDLLIHYILLFVTHLLIEIIAQIYSHPLILQTDHSFHGSIFFLFLLFSLIHTNKSCHSTKKVIKRLCTLSNKRC